MNANGSDEFRILALDGGGSKGVYSLGFLLEFEKLVKMEANIEMWKCFNLIYGTSTGAIIAALIALGNNVEQIIEHYFCSIPDVMESRGRSSRSRKRRSRKLKEHAGKIFGDAKFDAFQVDIGIVAMHYDYARPMIFKSSINQAHGSRGTFAPGFGCNISEAIVASCAAYPYFDRVVVETVNQGSPEQMDGGFVGNNPALFALADATKAFGKPLEAIRILNLGVGEYPNAPLGWFDRISRDGWTYKLFEHVGWPYKLIEKVLSGNTNTIDQLTRVLFPDVKVVRVNDSFTDNQYSTNFLESDKKKLRKIMDLGRQSFGKYEADVKSLFNFHEELRI